MRIVFAGSIAYDYLMTFPGQFKDHLLPDRIESVSLSFLVDGLTRHRGGIAPNIAYTYALLGGKGTVLGAAGQDFGEYRAWLESQGVDTSGVREIPGVFSASYFATTDQNNAQIASFYAGAMAYAAQCKVADLGFRPDLVVISPDDPAAMRDHVQECMDLGIRYFYDPSQQIVRMDLDDLRQGIAGAHMLIVNDYEFGLIESKLGLRREDIVDRGTILGITRGERGSVIYADGDAHPIPIYPADQVRDPTGVGDAFRGGFLRGVSAGCPWDICGKVGALAATYCLEQVGTQNHSYTAASFAARFRTHFDDGGLLDSWSR